MKDFSPQFSNPTQELLDAMQEKIYSLERRLNATRTDSEGTGELLRVERYDIWNRTEQPLLHRLFQNIYRTHMFCREDTV